MVYDNFSTVDAECSLNVSVCKYLIKRTFTSDWTAKNYRFAAGKGPQGLESDLLNSLMSKVRLKKSSDLLQVTQIVSNGRKTFNTRLLPPNVRTGLHLTPVIQC